MLTQSPILLHLNVRQFVGLHEHLLRAQGRTSVTIFRRSACMDNVRSEKALRAEDHEDWAYPKDCYDLYKSAEVHTFKRTLSAKYKRTLLLACTAAAMFVGVGIYLWYHMSKDDKPATPAQKVNIGGSAARGTGQPVPGAPKWKNRDEYLKAQLPRVGQAPWSAPLYDDRGITADPQLYCMSGGQGADGNGAYKDFSCTCITEQGTAYEMDPVACRGVARKGPEYNPFRSQSQQQQQQQQAQHYQQHDPVAASPSSGSVRVALAGNSAETFPEAPGYVCETCGK